MQCEDDTPHEAHTWWYERVVLNLAASIELEEPVGSEVITYEHCKGVR